MLDKFGDRRYLGELESRRIEQIENIYHSSKQTDVAAWDARYVGDALWTLNAQLDGDSTLAGQLARLLDNRNGLLIGETERLHPVIRQRADGCPQGPGRDRHRPEHLRG